jgi:hypothetical protein
MHNVAGIKGISMFITTQISLQTSLRRLRRAMTMILILANFAATLLADAARGGSTGARLIESLLICLLLIILMRTISGKKPGSILKSPGV